MTPTKVGALDSATAQVGSSAVFALSRSDVCGGAGVEAAADTAGDVLARCPLTPAMQVAYVQGRRRRGARLATSDDADGMTNPRFVLRLAYELPRRDARRALAGATGGR